MAEAAVPALTHGRKIAFTVGDYACNLYWQSVSIFLLFFYTDVVGLSAAVAGAIYMIASIFDGLIDPLMGIVADRTRTRWGRYRPYLILGAVPLGLSFALLYYKPPLDGWLLAAFVLGTHLLFRLCYTIVSIPYTSLNARLTHSSMERSTLAGYRMVFAMVAGLTVSLATQPIVAAAGQGAADRGFLIAAVVFATVATVIFPVVFLTTREPERAETTATRRVSLLASFRLAGSNLAFWILMIGMTCVVSAWTAIGKSVLYMFKYYLLDEQAAKWALAAGAGAAVVFIPTWVFVTKRTGKRGAWLLASAIAIAGLLAFSFIGVGSVTRMITFLLLMHFCLQGLLMTFWSMLPDTVEYGQHRTGVRSESFLFGLGQLFLKVALGLGAGAFGVALSAVGFVANVPQSASTLEGMRQIMVAFPLAALVCGAIAMFFYPMRRGGHEAIVSQLAAADDESRSRAG